MNKRNFVAAAAIALTTLAAAPAMAQEIKARMGHVFAANSTMDQAAQEFAKLVGERTKGKIGITVFPANQLGGEQAQARELSRGSLELALLNPGSLAGLNPLLDIHYLTHEEADRLMAELPEHLRDMAAFSLESGLRAANVTGLRWSAVDLSRKLAWVHPDEAKARKAIPVPLNGEAMSILQKQIGKHRDHVFTFNGQPVEQLSTAAWYKALKRAGIENFRWHDLRHTWASWHVQSGTPLHVLQELGGWASYAMVQRYAHLAADHLAPWADRLARPRPNRGTNPSQPTENDNDEVRQ
jgi:integrase